MALAPFDVMTRFVDSPDKLLTSWTLGRDGQKLTCALITQPSGTYVLRVSHEGFHVIDERCESPQQAITRSLEAYHLFVTRGWLHENSMN